MKYAVELKANIKIGRGRNVSASVATEMERKDEIQIGNMRDMLNEMVRGYTSGPFAVKTAVHPQSGPKMVSEKQLGLIRYMLKSSNISESDLCSRYSVHRLNELTMADARVAIQELKLDETFERP